MKKTYEYCSAWSRSQVQNHSFVPNQNTKLTVDPPPPPPPPHTHPPPSPRPKTGVRQKIVLISCFFRWLNS